MALIRDIAERGADSALLWNVYLDQGWTSLTDPCEMVELTIVLEELGRVTDPTPYLATMTHYAPPAGDAQRHRRDRGVRGRIGSPRRL